MTAAQSSQRLIIVLVSFFLCTGASIGFQVFVFQEESPLYQSVGKLAVSSPLLPSESGKPLKGHIADFNGIVVETLESAEMQRRAQDRSRTMNPEEEACEIDIDVSWPKDNHDFTISTTGKNPQFTQIFLDALLDEFIAFRKAAVEPTLETSEAWSIPKRASPAAKVRTDWQESAFSGAATGGLSGLVAGLLLALTFVRPAQAISAAELTLEQAPASAVRKKGRITADHRLLIWGFMLGTVFGLLIQIVRLTSSPPSFRALAKVVAAQGLQPREFSSHQVNDDYYGTLIETLESPELNSRAMKRVRVQNPELKDHDVNVRVAQTKGSAIFNVLATSDEPKYTRLFLDALLDEFIMLRTRQVEAAGMDPRQDAAVQERATPASEQIEDWNMPLLAGTLVGALLGGLFGLLWLLLKRFFRGQPEPLVQIDLNAG